MGTQSKETREVSKSVKYFLEQAVQTIELNADILTDEQLDRLESRAKALLWDRHNQPSGQLFSQEDKL